VDIDFVEDNYSRSRIDLVKEIVKKRKNFELNRQAIAELQKWPKDLPLSKELLQIVIVAFKEISILNFQRFMHVLRVIEYFHNLTNGNFNYFIDNLTISNGEILSDAILDTYRSNLKNLKDMYNNLDEYDKELLWFITILHDIGDAGKHAEHGIIGSELIELELSNSDYSQERIYLAKEIINYHIYPGMIAQGERTPGSLMKVINSISNERLIQVKFIKFLIILHVVDFAGWDLKGNKLTPNNLAERMEYLDKSGLRNLIANFWKYRLIKLSIENYNEPINVEYTHKIWEQIDKLMSEREKHFFKKHLNRTIELEDCMPIIHALSRNDHSSMKSAKRFVKFFRFLTQLAEIFKSSSLLVRSNHYPLEEENEFSLAYINNCIDTIPDEIQVVNVKEHLAENNMTHFYNMPIRIETNGHLKLIIDLDRIINELIVGRI